MDINARTASNADLSDLTRLYGLLAEEMGALSPLWAKASGLPSAPEAGLAALLADGAAEICVGTIDEVVVGFAVVISESLPAATDRMAAIRYIFTEQPAREVGVGEAMLAYLLQTMEATGHTLFDAHVLPGHRLAKNFFESAGFKARHIVMHRK